MIDKIENVNTISLNKTTLFFLNYSDLFLPLCLLGYYVVMNTELEKDRKHNAATIAANQEKKRGRPSIGATVKCSILLEPELHEWAISQPGGLAETVRNALSAWRRMSHQMPTGLKDLQNEALSSQFDMLPDKHQRSLSKAMSVLSICSDKEKYRLEIGIYFGSDDRNTISIYEAEGASHSVHTELDQQNQGNTNQDVEAEVQQ